MGYGIKRTSNRKWPKGFLKYKCIGGSHRAIRNLRDAFKIWNRQLGGLFVFREVEDGESVRVQWQVVDGRKDRGRWEPGDNGQNGHAPSGVVGRLLLGEEMTLGTILHEIGHMLGLSHENFREDATSNRMAEWIAEAWRPTHGPNLEEYGVYDLQSIMHYGTYSTKHQVSQGDVNAIKSIYR